MNGRIGFARLGGMAGIGVLAAFLVGCHSSVRSPKVFFLDGAGHFGAGFTVRRGLEKAGYIGAFETFQWSSWLGPGADHLVVARSKGKATQLADRITEARKDFPDGKIYVMGLSAGTALVLTALENLPVDVYVDGVVLFSPSVSANRNLVPALQHVRGPLYATCSPHDGILSALPVNADDGTGPPAGLEGFTLPHGLSEEFRDEYRKVVNLPWRPAYVGFGWRGGHVQPTTSSFVANVIAPRILGEGAYPLDIPLAATATAGRTHRSRVQRDMTPLSGSSREVAP